MRQAHSGQIRVSRGFPLAVCLVGAGMLFLGCSSSGLGHSTDGSSHFDGGMGGTGGTGTGGARSGGASDTGGVTGYGGMTSTGGATSSGGVTRTGGMIASSPADAGLDQAVDVPQADAPRGGAGGSGGTTGTGGTTRTGGAPATGGTTASSAADAGLDGRVETDAATNSCENPLPLQCGDRLNHSTLVQGRADAWRFYGCSQRVMSGPEAIYFLQLPTDCKAFMQLKNFTADLAVFPLTSCSFKSCSFATEIGQPSFVVVDGFNGAAGSYTLEVDCTCNQDAGTSDASAPSADAADASHASSVDTAISASEVSAVGCSPVTASSDLPGVRLEITSGPCALTQAQAAAGVSFDYRLVVDADVPGIVALNDLASCLQPDSSGLILAAEISGIGQWFCPTYDLGRCPLNSATTTAKAGSFDYELVWDGRNWQGPSDTNQPEGAAFPVGSYTLSVSATGTRLVDGGVLPFTVAVSRPLVIDGAH